MDANKISRKGAKVKTTTADEHGFTQIEADNSQQGREGHKEGPRTDANRDHEWTRIKSHAKAQREDGGLLLTRPGAGRCFS